MTIKPEVKFNSLSITITQDNKAFASKVFQLIKGNFNVLIPKMTFILSSFCMDRQRFYATFFF